MRFFLIISLFALIALNASSVQSQEQRPVPCSDHEFRRFDFWVGEWEVEANGKLAGRSRVTQILGDCVIFEEWESIGGGFAGKSFNRYDSIDGMWHQQWVDNQGTVLELSGNREGASMILEGRATGVDGNPVLHRITWTDNDDGSVRQVWESSRDIDNQGYDKFQFAVEIVSAVLMESDSPTTDPVDSEPSSTPTNASRPNASRS